MINLSNTISENQLTKPPHFHQSPPNCQPNWPTLLRQQLFLLGQDQEQDIPQHLEDGQGGDVTVPHEGLIRGHNYDAHLPLLPPTATSRTRTSSSSRRTRRAICSPRPTSQPCAMSSPSLRRSPRDSRCRLLMDQFTAWPGLRSRRNSPPSSPSPRFSSTRRPGWLCLAGGLVNKWSSQILRLLHYSYVVLQCLK